MTEDTDVEELAFGNKLKFFPWEYVIVILKNGKSRTGRRFFLLSAIRQRIAYCFQIHSHVALHTDNFRSKISKH